MNIERLTEIAEWLEGGAVHVSNNGEKYAFIMDFWKADIGKNGVQEHAKAGNLDWMPGDCGGAMCIGGAAEQFFGDEGEIEEMKREDEYCSDQYAAGLLGLPKDQAWDLFYPWTNYRVNDVPLTPQRAAKVIYHLIETGEVDWSILEGVESNKELAA